MKRKVIIVRHGESMGNIGMRTESAKAIPLSEKGHQQAQAVIQQLPQADAVIFSPYIRTQLTAAPYLKKFSHIVPEEWESIREFTFLSGSKYDNTTTEERAAPKEAFWMTNDPDYCDGTMAESFTAFVERAEEALEKIRNHPAQTLVVFSHEQFIQLIHFIHEHPQYREYRKTAEGMKELMRAYKQKVDTDPIPNATPIDISYLFE